MKLQYRNVGSSYTAYIQNARIFALKLEGGGTSPIGSATFDYTGSLQTWVVPAGVTSVTIVAYGAQGGTHTSYGQGGLGGRMEATLAVSAGQTIYIYVGNQPTSTTGGYNGGGNASNATYARGGGGASDVRIGGTALANRRVVAAGGGGGGMNCSSYQNHGGAGGTTTGQGGFQCNTENTYAQGVSQFSGGWGGYASGSLGTGGTGGSTYGGGGGGSNWTDGSIITNTRGVRSGNGQVIISW